ncbi:DUF2635 domain-containing protein [Variovorax sp. PAMC26660]|uniref:DUF2635 domain-containing protein n=1 Tax=Variovorax sp. PAMC26660 TaxID=2762322 RepID=UPI00164E233A|nr:DUF2635 domain-containing protein [Variovorax sp. PAMC26660]QNK65759.1 DUF2635 domain-containing protein [Variovorax sp. PAMC26660]
MYVKAAPGMKCRDPDLKDLLPDEGRDVPDTDYWQRRLRDGDVVPAEPPAAASEPAPVPEQAALTAPVAPKAEKAAKPDTATSTS